MIPASLPACFAQVWHSPYISENKCSGCRHSPGKLYLEYALLAGTISTRRKTNAQWHQGSTQSTASAASLSMTSRVQEGKRERASGARQQVLDTCAQIHRGHHLCITRVQRVYLRVRVRTTFSDWVHRYANDRRLTTRRETYSPTASPYWLA